MFPALFDYFNRRYPQLGLLRSPDDLEATPWESIELPYVLLRKKRRIYTRFGESDHPRGIIFIKSFAPDKATKREPGYREKHIHLSKSYVVSPSLNI